MIKSNQINGANLIGGGYSYTKRANGMDKG